MRAQFECDVTWFCFCFDFVCSFTCTVRLLLHSLFTFSSCVKKNMLITKWVLKMWIIIKKRHLVILLGNYTHKSVKPRKKQIVRLQLNENKSKESQTTLMSWYWKQKPTWRKDLIIYNTDPWICFLLIDGYHLQRGSSFEIGRARSRGWKNFGRRWTRRWNFLKIGQFSWTSYVYHPLLYVIKM